MTKDFVVDRQTCSWLIQTNRWHKDLCLICRIIKKANCKNLRLQKLYESGKKVLR